METQLEKLLQAVTWNAIQDLGIGVDCEEIERWRAMLDSPQKRNIIEVFSPEEIDYCFSFADPVPHLAGRWCAKEAVVKALARFKRVTVRDVVIAASAEGPRVEAPRSDMTVRVSISHSQTLAMAAALAIVR